MKNLFFTDEYKLLKTISLVIVLVFLSIMPGCSKQIEAMGSYKHIPILIDDDEKKELSSLISKAVEVEIRTPKKEKIFVLDYLDTTAIRRLESARTAIIVASLESKGPAGDFVRKSFSKEALNAIKSNQYWIVAKKDLWTKGQLVLIITAPTTDELFVRLSLSGNSIFKLINDSVNERVAKWLYGKVFSEGEQLGLEDSILAAYGFGIRVPRYFSWEKGTGMDRFIWLRALDPERWVFVWWSPLDSFGKLSIARWRTIRDSLCAKYYEGDIVSRKSAPSLSETYIDGKPAIQIRALWENPVNNIGGPLVSYIFADRKNKKIYIVDAAVFAPIVDKEPYLRHVEIISRSITTDKERFLANRKKRN